MRIAIAVVVLASVHLGGPFGEATASTVSLESDTIVVDIQVEVLVSAQAVVAHLSTGEDDTRVISLIDRGGGVFGIRTELPRKDYLVVFEAVGDPGQLSASTTLSAMGVQLTHPGSPDLEGDQSGEDGLTDETRRWGWLALALAAAALSVLAFWVLAGRDEEGQDTAPDEEE